MVFLVTLVLLDLLLEAFNLPYGCTHRGDVIVVFLVTLVLLDLLQEGFNLPYEFTQNKQLPAQHNGKFFNFFNFYITNVRNFVKCYSDPLNIYFLRWAEIISFLGFCPLGLAESSCFSINSVFILASEE